MSHRGAAGVLLFLFAGILLCSGIRGQSREAEIAFGKDHRYVAALLCCWRIVVYEQQAGKQVVNWEWDKFEGTVGEKKDFLVRDVDGDGNEEVAFQVTQMNMCLEENVAVLYSPEKQAVFLLKFDGESTAHLSPNLKDNQKVREWLVTYWQDRHRVDPAKITISYDAQP